MSLLNTPSGRRPVAVCARAPIRSWRGRLLAALLGACSAVVAEPLKVRVADVDPVQLLFVLAQETDTELVVGPGLSGVRIDVDAVLASPEALAAHVAEQVGATVSTVDGITVMRRACTAGVSRPVALAAQQARFLARRVEVGEVFELLHGRALGVQDAAARDLHRQVAAVHVRHAAPAAVFHALSVAAGVEVTSGAGGARFSAPSGPGCEAPAAAGPAPTVPVGPCPHLKPAPGATARRCGLLEFGSLESIMPRGFADIGDAAAGGRTVALLETLDGLLVAARTGDRIGRHDTRVGAIRPRGFEAVQRIPDAKGVPQSVARAVIWGMRAMGSTPSGLIELGDGVEPGSPQNRYDAAVVGSMTTAHRVTAIAAHCMSAHPDGAAPVADALATWRRRNRTQLDELRVHWLAWVEREFAAALPDDDGDPASRAFVVKTAEALTARTVSSDVKLTRNTCRSLPGRFRQRAYDLPAGQSDEWSTLLRCDADATCTNLWRHRP